MTKITNKKITVTHQRMTDKFWNLIFVFYDLFGICYLKFVIFLLFGICDL
jgi:hypothetical protein